MEVVLLGTGSADGWPNPFCSCASCNCAHASNELRGQTSALVDGRILIDCGPEAPRAAVRLGHRLGQVHTLLFTHNHPDHLGPAALLFRHWAHRSEPLQVIGPPAVIAACRPWVGPTDPITFLAVSPGDSVAQHGYTIRALAAAHQGPEIGPAVLYDIESAGGARLFYAADTGPLPESTYAQLRDATFDIALIEETFGDNTEHGTDHLDLPTFATTLARLRRLRAITDTTQIVAIHLSHHNPPSTVLSARLAAWGVALLPDGARIRSGAPMLPPPPPRRTLVLGGARSGKSVHAEQLLLDQATVTYVATSEAHTDDEEWRQRITAHRRRRPAHWSTLESTDLVGVLSSAGLADVLLIDCLTLWLTQVLNETAAWDGDAKLANNRIDELVDAWIATNARVVAVSNEVGSGIVPEFASGRMFRDLQGMLNARLAAVSDEVTLVVAGQPMRIRQ